MTDRESVRVCKQFVKKPIVVEAVQWDGSNVQAVREFLPRKVGGFGHDMKLGILTREGRVTVSVGDWIIRVMKGEFYPCKPDIFTETYEPLAEPAEPSGGPLCSVCGLEESSLNHPKTPDGRVPYHDFVPRNEQPPIPTAEDEWPLINAARGRLIDRDITGMLNAEEKEMLTALNVYTDSRLQRLTPKPPAPRNPSWGFSGNMPVLPAELLSTWLR